MRLSFTVTGGVYSRQHDEPTPKQGEWSKYGSSIEVNGVKIPPPVWDHPGARADLTKLEPDGKTYKGAVYSNDLCETPLGNDFYYSGELAEDFPFWRQRFIPGDEELTDEEIAYIQGSVSNCKRPPRGSEYIKKDSVVAPPPEPTYFYDDDEDEYAGTYANE